MDFEKKSIIFLAIKLILLIIFTIFSVLNNNFEFLYYAIIMFCLILGLIIYYKKVHLPNTILIGLLILGIMHIFGGLYFLDIRIYDLKLIKNILTYGNFVQALGIFLLTFIAYNFLHHHLDKELEHNIFFLSLILTLLALGIGTLDSLLEIVLVALFNLPKTTLNSNLSLIFDFLGAIIACIWIGIYHRKSFYEINYT